MKPKKHLTLMAKIWISVGALVLGLVLFRATQILLDYRNLRRNEKAITTLANEISKSTNPSEISKDNYCQEVHQKYSEGPKSCYVTQSLYFSSENKTKMMQLTEDIKKKVQGSNTQLATVGDEKMRLERYSEQSYTFKNEHQECSLSFYYYTNESIKMMYDSGSKQGKSFRGLVATISCGQGVKWAYYPLY